MKSFQDLSDEELIAGFRETVIDEQQALALQVRHLREMDRRHLFFESPSLWAYLIDVYGMDASQAEKKIRAARMSARCPEILQLLESGKLNLTLLEIAQGCTSREKLTGEELSELLSALSGMSTRAARRAIAIRYPQQHPELPKDRVIPIDGEHSEIRFIADQELLDYRMRHHPEEKAKRAQAREAKCGAPPEVGSESPSDSRHSESKTNVENEPAATNPESSPSVQTVVAVASKDRRAPTLLQTHELIRAQGYRCAYIDPKTDQSCGSRYRLEKDHITAWAGAGPWLRICGFFAKPITDECRS